MPGNVVSSAREYPARLRNLLAPSFGLLPAYFSAVATRATIGSDAVAMFHAT